MTASCGTSGTECQNNDKTTLSSKSGDGDKKDEGYAWFIVMSCFLCHTMICGISFTVGVTFVIFLDAFGDTKGITAWVGSLNTASVYAIGPISSVLTNRFGCRPVAILGGIISSIGLGTSAFATSIYHLYFTFGIMTGCGLGLVYLPAMVIINQYFDKRKTLAFGIAVSGVGCGSFVYPPLIEALNKEYGWRGTMIVLSGIGLNICTCGASMRPFRTNKPIPDMETTKRKDDSVFNVAIFKSLSFDILCFNNVAFCFGLSVVYSHLSEYSLLMGIGGNESFMLFSVMGIVNLMGRFIFGVIGHHPLTNEVLLYICTFFISGATTFVVPLLTQYGTLLAYSAIFGLFTAAYGVLLPVLICEFLSESELASGLGAVLPFCALGTMLGGPVAGFLYDNLHSYKWSFLVGGGSMVASALSIIVPYWRGRHLNAKKVTEERNNTSDKNLTSKPETIPASKNNFPDGFDEKDNLLEGDDCRMPRSIEV